jgi:hypothetical protein
MPAVEKNLKRDLSTLRELIDFQRVPVEHPLRTMWSSPSSEARFELHHLADDLRVVRSVDGFPRLLRQLLGSADTYEDFRYELRLAGVLGRSDGQRVLRLGGDNAGPDIEFSTRSGHKCGVACYRANSATPAVAEVPKKMQAIVKAFAPAMGTFAPRFRLFHEVIFPSFPVQESFVEAAGRLLTNLWMSPNGEPGVKDGSGIQVRRVAAIESSVPTASIRFLFPVPAREAFRLERHVRDKVEKENRWASSYKGVALFAMEQPTLGHELNHDLFQELLLPPGSGLAAVVTSRASFPNEGALRHRMEHINVVAHPELTSTSFNVGIETFGDNNRGWAGDVPCLELNLDHAWEEWDLRLEGGQVHCDRRLPLSIVRQMERLPPLSDGPLPADEAFAQRTEEALRRMFEHIKMK